VDTALARQPLEVALVAERWLGSAEWSRRGLLAVPTPPTALDRLATDPPGALVVDLPYLAGRKDLEVCWRLHDLFGVPVVLVAEGAPADAVVAWLDRGAEDVVTGAITARDLAARVAAVLRRIPRRPPRDIPRLVQLGDVEIDMVRQVVRRDGATHSLSRTEFALLLALVRAGGRTCAHGDLINSVWGPGYTSSSHYLRLYVRYLRQKIEREPCRPRYLLNAWGLGYRLVLDVDAGGEAGAAQRPSPGAVPAPAGAR
jgi:two-component system KDP operon response regulator KdpE